MTAPNMAHPAGLPLSLRWTMSPAKNSHRYFHPALWKQGVLQPSQRLHSDTLHNWLCPFAIIFLWVWLVQAFLFLLAALTMPAVVTGTSRKTICISMVSSLAVLNLHVIYAEDLNPPCRLPFGILEVHQPPERAVVCPHFKMSPVNVVVEMPHSCY